jgi:hypothetical protein
MDLLPELRVEFVIPALGVQDLQAFSQSSRENKDLVYHYLARNYEPRCLPLAAARGVDGLAWQAARSDSVACLRFAEDYGMSDIKDSLVLVAARYNSVNVLRHLLGEESAKRDSVVAAARHGSKEAFDFLWSTLSQEQQQKHAQRVLNSALVYGQKDIVETLLSSNFDVSVRISHAAKSCNEELVKMLLQRRLPPNHQELEEAFRQAWRRGCESVVSALLDFFSPPLRNGWFDVLGKRSRLTQQQKRRLLLSALSEQERELFEATKRQDVDKVSQLLLGMNAYENNLGKAMALSVVNNPVIDSLLRTNAAETVSALQRLFTT